MRALALTTAVALAAATIGCSGGGGGEEDTSVDQAEDLADPGTDGAADADDEEAATTCEPPATATGSAGHLPGMDCGSCHDSMAADLRWTVSGTLYSDAAGTSPVAGATVVVEDSDHHTYRLSTHTNGVFYTTQAMAFPVSVYASRCPDTAGMAAAAAGGSCNSCHVAGSRIHLP